MVKVNNKKLLAFLFITVLLLGSNYVGITTINKTEKEYLQIVNYNDPLRLYVSKVRSNLFKRSADLRGLMLYKDPIYAESFTKASKEQTANFAKISTNSDEEAKLFAHLKMDDANYNATALTIINDVKTGNTNEAFRIAAQGRAIANDFNQTCDRLAELISRRNKSVKQQVVAKMDRVNVIMFTMSAILTVLACLLKPVSVLASVRILTDEGGSHKKGEAYSGSGAYQVTKFGGKYRVVFPDKDPTDRPKS